NLDIFLAISSDNGQTFTNPAINLSSNIGNSLSPQVAAVESSLYVAWIDAGFGNGDILIAASSDNGQTFTNPSFNLSNSSGTSSAPSIIVQPDIGNIYAAWQDDTSGNAEILFSRSTDNGQNFSVIPNNLSNNDGMSSMPSVATFSNNVYVAWEDNSGGNLDIFLAISSDNGQNFRSPVNLSNNGDDSFSVRTVSAGDITYLAWTDFGFGNGDIIFRFSIDSG